MRSDEKGRRMNEPWRLPLMTRKFRVRIRGRSRLSAGTNPPHMASEPCDMPIQRGRPLLQSLPGLVGVRGRGSPPKPQHTADLMYARAHLVSSGAQPSNGHSDVSRASEVEVEEPLPNLNIAWLITPRASNPMQYL
jgi:hypothetical protein